MYISLNVHLQKLHLPEQSLAKNYIFLNMHLLEITFARRLIWKKLHMAVFTFPQKLTYFSEFLLERNHILLT